jgi:hypothetical protein
MKKIFVYYSINQKLNISLEKINEIKYKSILKIKLIHGVSKQWESKSVKKEKKSGGGSRLW